MFLRPMVRTGVIGAVLAGAAVLVSVPAASAAPAQSTLGPAAAPACDSFKYTQTGWSANCRILQGDRARAITNCSNGAVKTGPWQTAGYWRFGGECAPWNRTGSTIEFNV